MATHSLAIAKASLAAGMMRPDPNPVSRADVASFHALLEGLVDKCTPANVEHCKDWLATNAIPSAVRIVAVGKYLVALASSFSITTGEAKRRAGSSAATSGRRKRLHILYLISDLLHHSMFHVQSSSTFSVFADTIQPYLTDLFGLASDTTIAGYVRHQEKINELLEYWERKGYYRPVYIEKLRETVRCGAQSGYSTNASHSRPNKVAAEEPSGQSKDVPYIMPATHGDSSMPFYDLPAANMMPHIIPNRVIPINPQLVKPLQFAAGPADETLAAAVRDFLKDVELIYRVTDDAEETLLDFDSLGQPAIRDEESGEILEREGYYGWSKAFCERMKMKHNGVYPVGHDSKRSQSEDRSVSPRKRRRLSYTDSSRGRSRTHSRATSMSSSRSRSRTRDPVFSRRRSLSRSRSLSQRRRSCESRGHTNSHSPHQSHWRPTARSRSRSYSPDPYQIASTGSQPPKNPQPAGSSPTPPFPFPNTTPGPFPVPPLGLPIPPPPPLNYKGIWPPPPPPPPPALLHGQHSGAPANSFPSFPHFVPPPPPPSMSPGQFSGSSLSPAPHGPSSYPGQPQNQSSTWVNAPYTNSSRPLYNEHGGRQSSRDGRGG